MCGDRGDRGGRRLARADGACLNPRNLKLWDKKSYGAGQVLAINVYEKGDNRRFGTKCS